jgi:hypothetical protein
MSEKEKEKMSKPAMLPSSSDEEEEEEGEDEESSDPLFVDAEDSDVSNSDKQKQNRAPPSKRRSAPSSTTTTTSSLLCNKGWLSRQQQQFQFQWNRFFTLLKRWLKCYVQFCANANHQDKILKVAQWSVWLIGATRAGQQQQQTPSHASRWLFKLSNEISFARYLTRFLGLPTAIEAACHSSWNLVPIQNDSLKNNSNLARFYKICGNVLAYSMIFYYPTEHMAYIKWMEPPRAAAAASVSNPNSNYRLTRGKKNGWWLFPSTWKAETWSYVSCRFWLTYIVTEIAQCCIRWIELKNLLLDQQQQEQHKQQVDDQGKQESSEWKSTPTTSAATYVQELESEKTNVELQLVRDVLFFFPCLHWSLPKWDTDPWLPTSSVNGLMWIESIVSMIQAIRNAKFQ